MSDPFRHRRVWPQARECCWVDKPVGGDNPSAPCRQLTSAAVDAHAVGPASKGSWVQSHFATDIVPDIEPSLATRCRSRFKFSASDFCLRVEHPGNW